MTNTYPRLQSDRQHKIYLHALRHGSVEVAELADEFQVTTETIRRDLSELQERNLLKRVHGGATLIERIDHEPRLSDRDAHSAAEKLRIAEATLAFLPTGGSIMIDSGSTLKRVADIFPSDTPIHVVTNSLLVGAALVRRGVERITMLGGSVRTNTYAMVDSWTIDAVRRLRTDLLLISCDGLSFTRGLTTPYSEEAAIKRAMLESADKVVALVDASKFGNGQMFSYADFEEIDVLVTDSRVDDRAVATLTEHGIEVRVA